MGAPVQLGAAWDAAPCRQAGHQRALLPPRKEGRSEESGQGGGLAGGPPHGKVTGKDNVPRDILAVFSCLRSQQTFQ